MSELSTMLHVLRTPQDSAPRLRRVPAWEYALLLTVVLFCGSAVLVVLGRWL